MYEGHTSGNEAAQNDKEKCISEESFNEQFSKDIILSPERGEVMYTKVTPETIKFPEPVIYIAGFSQGKDTYIGEIRDLVESGREVLFSNPIKGFDVSDIESYKYMQEEYGLPDTILQKVAAIEEIIREEECANAELVGHSQGGIIASVLAAKYPTLAKDLVLVSPAGFEPGESRMTLLKNFVFQLVSNTKRKYSSDTSDEVKTSMGQAGVSFGKEAIRAETGDSRAKTMWWRWNTEIPGIAEVDILPILEYIKNLNEETRVTLIVAKEDELFKPGMYADKLGENPLQYVDHWLSFIKKDAGHTAAGIEESGLLQHILNNDRF